MNNDQKHLPARQGSLGPGHIEGLRGDLYTPDVIFHLRRTGVLSKQTKINIPLNNVRITVVSDSRAGFA